MADPNLPSRPRRRRVWLRVFGWIAGVLVLLAVAAYFLLASSAVFKSVILPQVSEAVHADVTVSDADINPFREVVLHDLKVQGDGDEPVIVAPEVRARYHLFDLIRGKIRVDEVVITSPTVQLIEHSDGTSNLDQLGKKERSREPSQPLDIELRRLTVRDGTVRQVKLYANGQRDVTELSDVSVTLNHVRNGQSGTLEVAANVKAENNPPSPAAPGSLQAALTGNFEFALANNLAPSSIQGGANINIGQATGSLTELAGLQSDLKCDVTPTEIRQLALQFHKGGDALGELRASGPFTIAKSEGTLKVDLMSLDRRVLNLAGARRGVDFGTTTINSTNELQLANAGGLITAAGRFEADKVQLIRPNRRTPTLELHADYIVTVNRGERTALLHSLSMNGVQDGRPLLKTELTRPMNLSWGNTTNALGDSSLNVTVTDLRLDDWKPFLGEKAPSGLANLNARLASQEGGRQLAFDLDAGIADLNARVGDNRISQATLSVRARGESDSLKQFKLDEYQFTLAQQNQQALTVSGSGTYDRAAEIADLHVQLQASLAQLFRMMGRDDVTASSGTAELKGHVTQRQQTQTLSGNLAIKDLTGRFGKSEFDRFGTAADLDLTKTPEQLEIRKAVGNLTQSGNDGGHFEITGAYGFGGKPAQMTARISDFNQNGLRPFLEPLLADKQLVSVAVNGNVSTEYNPGGQSTTKADLRLANLVVKGPQQSSPAEPLEARVQLDAVSQDRTAEVRQFQIALTPTAQARNELQVTGRVNFSDTNAIQGDLKLTAESVDVTRYYDLFVGERTGAEQPQSRSQRTSAAPSQPGATTTQSEPEPKKLPFRNLTLDASVGRLYLREVAVTNLHAGMKVFGSRIVLNPFELSLNGAPMNAAADVDLSVRGYKYALRFDMDQVPFTPLVNTFKPERKGQLGGTLTARGQVSGIGITGASLQRSLAGNFDINTTNLNLQMANLRSPFLKSMIDVVVTLPDLIRNPENIPLEVVTSFTQGVLKGGRGGLADEITKYPIDIVTARGTAGGGKVDLQDSVVRSAAFEANARGVITLAPVLTNSPINIPVSLAVSPSVAERANIAADTNAPYVRLPDFLTMTGTLGKPRKQINKVALLSAAFRGGRHDGGETNKSEGGVLPGLGGILSGGGQSSTNAPPLDSSTNQPPKNPLDILRGVIPK